MTITIGKRSGNAIVPLANVTKRTKEVDLTVTSAQAGWSTISAKAIFYADSNDVWRMRFNIRGDFTSASPTSVIFSITGVNTSAVVAQAVAGMLGINISPCKAYIIGSSVTLYPETAATANGAYASGDVLLSAEPTTYTTTANLENMPDIAAYIPPASATEAGILTADAQTVGGVKTFNSGIKPSATSSTLDHYEEGTITMTAGNLTPTNCTLSGASYNYVKIGNIVTIKITLTLTSNSGSWSVIVPESELDDFGTLLDTQGVGATILRLGNNTGYAGRVWFISNNLYIYFDNTHAGTGGYTVTFTAITD